jgi:hypothetical protein
MIKLATPRIGGGIAGAVLGLMMRPLARRAARRLGSPEKPTVWVVQTISPVIASLLVARLAGRRSRMYHGHHEGPRSRGRHPARPVGEPPGPVPLTG